MQFLTVKWEMVHDVYTLYVQVILLFFVHIPLLIQQHLNLSVYHLIYQQLSLLCFYQVKELADF